jgi:hypothetical protein
MASNVNGQFNMTEVNTDSHISFEPFDDRSESGDLLGDFRTV